MKSRRFVSFLQNRIILPTAWELSGETYLNTLQSEDRVTWVGTDGVVLYDSAADAATMGNHANRTEIAEAMQDGNGQSAHYSETLMARTLYYAQRLEDGSVLRVSCNQSTVMAMLLGAWYPTAALLAVVLLLCVLMAFRMAHQIVRPINRIDLDHPSSDQAYPELSPLISRLQQQNQTIRKQMDALSRQQREFAALTDNMSEGFLLVDSRTEVLFGNQSALRFLGGERSKN